MNELFTNWLHSGDKDLLRLVLPRETYLFLRAEKRPGFDYLYCQRQYGSDGLRRHDGFQYAGLYCAADALIYDADYALTHMDGADKTLPARSCEALRRQLQQDVRTMIEQRVDNDRGHLTVHELADEKFLCALDTYRKYYAARDVRQRYLETGELDSDGFRCRYVPEGWAEDSLLSYIADPLAYAEREAECYWTENQEEMYLQFLEQDARDAEQAAIAQNPQNPVHIVRQIMAVMNAKLTESLDAARQKNADLRQQVTAATKQYERFSRELGESDSATLAAKANLDALSQEYADSSAEVKKLEGQLAANTKSLQNNADAVTKARTNLNNAQGALRQTEQQIRTTTERLARMQSAWTKAGDTLTAFGKKCASVSASMEKLGKGMTTALTTPVLALGTAAIKASVEYESAFASVRKTVDATEAEYEQLSDAVKKMSTEVATDAADIAEVMANAGQLGIQNDYLVEFTRTMIDLGNSTDIAADEAATAIAQFANITKMSQADFGRFGSALVDLGNNYATTESAIMNMATRLAAAGSQVGLTQAQILGFATALSSVGLEAQAGGMAFSKAMIEMQVAVETNGKSLKDFARVAGLTTEEFKALWNSDPAGAIEKFIVGLSQMDEQGVSSIVTLQEMGFTEVRLRDTLMRATNATELFSEAQQTATSAWEDNVALSNEAGKRYATTESKRNCACRPLVAERFHTAE